MATRIIADRDSPTGYSVVDEQTGAKRPATAQEAGIQGQLATATSVVEQRNNEIPEWMRQQQNQTFAGGAAPPRPPSVPSTAKWDGSQWADEANGRWFTADGTIKGGSRDQKSAPVYTQGQVEQGFTLNPDRTGAFNAAIGQTQAAGQFNQQGLLNEANARGTQAGLIQQLQARAMGRGGPSLAEMQLNRAGANNMQQAAALQAAGRGQGRAGMNYNIANQQAQISQQTGLDAAQLRAQEQLAAQTALGQVAGQARGQDQSFVLGQQQGQLAGASASSGALGQAAAYDVTSLQARIQGMSSVEARAAAMRELEMAGQDRDEARGAARRKAALDILAGIAGGVGGVAKGVAGLGTM